MSVRREKSVLASDSVHSRLASSHRAKANVGQLIGIRASRAVGVTARTATVIAGNTSDDADPGRSTRRPNGSNLSTT